MTTMLQPADGSPPPAVSVVMPMRNAMPYLPAAIESILNQSFGDFELVIGDDASTDGSLACATEFAARDPRIRLMHNDTRLGPVGSSNWVARAARAPLVARMDADDISRPDRLALQVKALALNPDAVLVGSLYELIDSSGRATRSMDRSSLLARPLPPIAHTSVMYRRTAFDQIGGYAMEASYFEDVDLYRRLAKVGGILVIADELVKYRLAGTGARLMDDRRQVERALNAMPVVMAQTAGAPRVPSKKLAPEVFREFGSQRLWARQPPAILYEMATRMRIRPLRASLRVVVWAVLCSISPSLTRQAARTRVAWRNWRMRHRLPHGHLFRWVERQHSIDLGGLEADLPLAGDPAGKHE